MAVYRALFSQGNRGSTQFGYVVPLIFLCGTTYNARERAGRHVQETASQAALQFRLVLQSELEQRIRATEDELLADIVAVIFDCAVVDKQFCGD